MVTSLHTLDGANNNQRKTATTLNKAGAAFATVTGAVLAIGALIYWFKPDRSLPSLDKLNVVTFLPVQASGEVAASKEDVLAVLKKQQGVINVNGDYYSVHSGVPSDISKQPLPVFMYAGGYSNGCKPYAFGVYTAMKAGNISGPCVVFDYATDTRRAFNFCREQDLHCLNTVYQELLKKHPHGQVILYGACKGATNKLRFLAECAEQNQSIRNIKAAIVESPTISPKDALKDIQNAGPLSHLLCRFTMPNYSHKLKTIMHAQSFPHKVPVLLGSLPEDTLSALPDMIAMKEHLTSKGGNIEHVICAGDDAKIRHGKIGTSRAWQGAIQQFLARHTLRPASAGDQVGSQVSQ